MKEGRRLGPRVPTPASFQPIYGLHWWTTIDLELELELTHFRGRVLV